MKILRKINLLLYFLLVDSNAFELPKLIKATDFYQITIFLSENITVKTGMKVPFFHEIPSVTHTFDFKLKNKVASKSSEGVMLKIAFVMQESLVIFYTSNTEEWKLFIDFLIPQLTIRKRPKCLIIFSQNSLKDNEMDITYILKYAWSNKFLDFSILVTAESSLINSSSFIYYYNPFDDAIHRKKDFELFPDKLGTIGNYPLYSTDNINLNQVLHIRRPNKKLHINPGDYFAINFAANILNFDVTVKNVTLEIPVTSGFLKNWGLDVVPAGISGLSYPTSFVIPTDETSGDIVAFVPILPASKTGIFFKMVYNFMIIFGMVSIFSSVLNYYENAVKHMKVFDVVRLFLGQSIERDVQKMVHRIIMATFIVTSFMFMNDTLFDIISITFEKTEVPFETYEDLYNSQLQTYSDVTYLNSPDLQKTEDEYLLKILNRTVIEDFLKPNNCFGTLTDSKNVSCIVIPDDIDLLISAFSDENDMPVMKVAQPPIVSGMMPFYMFAEGSPYAMKFLEVMRRVRETNLMHWPALVEKDRDLYFFEEKKDNHNSGVESVHLLIFMSIGCLMSFLVFIVELIVFKIKLKFFKKGLLRRNTRNGGLFK